MKHSPALIKLSVLALACALPFAASAADGSANASGKASAYGSTHDGVSTSAQSDGSTGADVNAQQH